MSETRIFRSRLSVTLLTLAASVVVIAGMRAAPNLGRDYASEFDGVYPAVASKYHAALVPFLLQDVAAQRGLNQADGIHPTAEGHALIADRVWQELRSILR